MGRKIHPVAFRIGVIRGWQSKWYADREYAESLREDLKIRRTIQSNYTQAGISQIQVDRQTHMVSVTIHTARPGVVIGRGGQRVDEMKRKLEFAVGKKIQLNIQEIQQPELDAQLVAETIAGQIENRIAYRRAMKQAMSRSNMAGAKGIRISCSGRLGGAEIARRMTMHDGRVPLQTLRADIDYGFTEARTTLGRIGVKVWLYRGEILPEREIEEAEEAPPQMAVFEESPPELLKAESTPAEAVEVEEAKPEAVSVSPEPETSVAPETMAKPERPVAAESLEAAPEEKAAEEKPAKATKRRKTKAVSAAEKEKPVAKRITKKAAEEKPAEPTTKKRTRKAAATVEEKPSEPAPKRRTRKTTAAKEEKIQQEEAETS